MDTLNEEQNKQIKDYNLKLTFEVFIIKHKLMAIGENCNEKAAKTLKLLNKLDELPSSNIYSVILRFTRIIEPTAKIWEYSTTPAVSDRCSQLISKLNSISSQKLTEINADFLEILNKLSAVDAMGKFTLMQYQLQGSINLNAMSQIDVFAVLVHIRNKEADAENEPKPQEPVTEEKKYIVRVYNHEEPSEEVRQGSVELLFKSLNVPPLPANVNIRKCAIELEAEIYKVQGQNNKRYMRCVRSRVFNLYSKGNAKLRNQYLLGNILPADLAIMTHQQMATEEMNRTRKQMEKENLQAAQLMRSQANQNDLVKCNRCKSHNCTYTQLQTRSADEPMTTFAECQDCGQRMRF